MTDDQMAMGRRQLQLEQDLIAGGMHPSEAASVAAEEVLGLPGRRRSRESLDAARAAAPPVSYGNAATLDNLDGVDAELVVEDVLGGSSPRAAVPQSARVYRDDPTQGLAGVLAAREAADARSWEERGRHYGNPDPASRGMVPTYNPETGEAGYSVAYPMPDANGEMPPGAPGRPGVRRDLRRPVIDTATGQPIQGSHKYDKQLRDGPDRLVEVYAPSPEFRRELQEREDRNRTRRLATRAGYDPMAAAAMATSENAPNLDALRLQGDALRAASKAARQQAVIRRAQAQSNPLEYMNRDDVSDWNRMVAADGMLRRGYRGATPLDVEGAHNRQLTELGLRVAQGQGFQQLTPEQRSLVEIKAAEAERGMPAEERAAKYRDAPAVHPSESEMADRYVGEMYSVQSNWALGGTTSSFTADEQQATVDWLVNEKGYRPEKARKIVDGIARTRNAQSWWGNSE